MILLKIVIEDLFKKILILVISLNSAVFGSDIILMNEHEYVPVNFIPLVHSPDTWDITSPDDANLTVEPTLHVVLPSLK